MICDNIFTYF